MDRIEFIQKTLLAGAALSVSPVLLSKEILHEKPSKEITQIGFNHLPNKELKTMNSILHKAESRGTVNHGWLEAKHTFSFANYYNPDRMHFGVLRVLNDDKIKAGKGFGMHPHDNMEIITIPFKGGLEHKDNMGNGTVIESGDIQVMSAGTGIYHSEFATSTSDVNLFQIWMFPNKKNVEPRYDQQKIPLKKNTFNQILSPNKDDDGVWVHQDAWFSIAHFDKDFSDTYTLKNPNNGVYAIVIEGDITIEDQELHTRDGFGIWNTKTLIIKSNNNSKVLLMEVPLTL